MDEKIIQIAENKVLTNRGRIFYFYRDMKGKEFWTELELPNFNDQRGDTTSQAGN